MKFLKQAIKIITVSIFLSIVGCHDNKTVSNSIAPKTDSLAVSQVENSKIEDSVVNTAQKKECLIKSNDQLPYSKKIDINKVSYQTTDCAIEGIDKLLCGNKTLRYIPLPNFENMRVVLVPMDCGDFNYRFFLATILENKLLSSMYVEGEWYEPGDESYKELTSFTIDEDYKITITKKSSENSKVTSTEVTNFTISPDGTFEKAQ